MLMLVMVLMMVMMMVMLARIPLGKTLSYTANCFWTPATNV
ncbi:hypothetical protein N9L68_06885 [bacterium]|nr:hypothetical protein [bacterium]